MRLLMQFSASGVSVLVATHDTGLLETFDFPQIRLHHGELIDVYPGGAASRQRAQMPQQNEYAQ